MPCSPTEKGREELAEERQRLVAQLHDRHGIADVRRSDRANETAAAAAIAAIAAAAAADVRRYRFGERRVQARQLDGGGGASVQGRRKNGRETRRPEKVRSCLAQSVRARRRLQPLSVRPGTAGDVQRPVNSYLGITVFPPHAYLVPPEGSTVAGSLFIKKKKKKLYITCVRARNKKIKIV